MQVLIEQSEATNHILLEEGVSGATKKYVIEGICIQSNIQNKNKRKYPKDVVAPEIERYIREDINNNTAVGELNHPTTDPRINYERVSHRFESLTMQGDNWIGKAVIANKTPMGGIVAGLMEAGVRMGISTRALGSVKQSNGCNIVQSDFRLISAGDIVSDPSAPDAFLTNLMEGKEWVFANGILQEKENKNLVNMYARNRKLNEAGMRALFKTILSKIKE